jgi:phosphonate transport system permease protein
MVGAMDRRSFYERWGRWILLLLIAIPVYTWGWQVTEIDIGSLISGAPKAVPIISDLLHPSLVTRGEQIQLASTRIQVPCVDPDTILADDIPDNERSGAITVTDNCLDALDPVGVSGEGFRPNTDGRLFWRPVGSEGRLRDERFVTDEAGAFSVETDVPQLLADIPGNHQLQAEVAWESGDLEPSEALLVTIDKMIETIFLALMATTFASVVAIPLSFLGARNLMPNTPLGNGTYITVRTIFNVTRAIEPLIVATVFAIWVGFGPFAGVLALTISTIANIGKLYSEAVESIDNGPLEAIRATGANGLQMVAYGVVPQIVSPYISFTVYYWDINVRMSTIIGFVGGGGIGMELGRWINQLQWQSAATAVWAIVIVVTIMDYTSAVVRERLS